MVRIFLPFSRLLTLIFSSWNIFHVNRTHRDQMPKKFGFYKTLLSFGFGIHSIFLRGISRATDCTNQNEHKGSQNAKKIRWETEIIHSAELERFAFSSELHSTKVWLWYDSTTAWRLWECKFVPFLTVWWCHNHSRCYDCITIVC